MVSSIRLIAPTTRFASPQYSRMVMVKGDPGEKKLTVFLQIDIPGGNSNGESVMNIYVGNLSYNTTEGSLRTAFEPHGEVTSAAVISDRDSGRSKGFGFVEMADDEQARAAIKALDGSEVDGRQIKVNEARPRAEGGGGRGGGGRGGGGGGGGGRNRW